MSESFRKEIEAVLEQDDPDEVLSASIDVALGAQDAEWAESCLLRLAAHANTEVRGNAMIGFAHLAERFGALDRARIEPVLQAGLQDEKQHVRDQAEAALDEIAECLGWSGAREPGPSGSGHSTPLRS